MRSLFHNTNTSWKINLVADNLGTIYGKLVSSHGKQNSCIYHTDTQCCPFDAGIGGWTVPACILVNCRLAVPLKQLSKLYFVSRNLRARNSLSCYFVSVDGAYTPWTQWSECTATCGGGTQMRNRSCTNPPPQNEGKTCLDQGLGPQLETQNCNMEPCPSKLFRYSRRLSWFYCEKWFYCFYRNFGFFWGTLFLLLL